MFQSLIGELKTQHCTTPEDNYHQVSIPYRRTKNVNQTSPLLKTIIVVSIPYRRTKNEKIKQMNQIKEDGFNPL